MIIPVGYAHVQHFFAGSGLPNGAAITYGVSGFGENDPATLAELLHDNLVARWQSHWASTCSLEETRVKFGPNSTGPFGSHVERVIGSNVSSGMPPQVAYLVEKRTAFGGRAGRGRIYMPGCIEVNIDAAGFIVAGALTSLQTAANNWLLDIEADSTGMFLFHTASSDPTRVTQLTIDPVAATQRRRLR